MPTDVASPEAIVQAMYETIKLSTYQKRFCGKPEILGRSINSSQLIQRWPVVADQRGVG